MARKGTSTVTAAKAAKYLELIAETGLKELSAQEVGVGPCAMLRYRQNNPEYDDKVEEAMSLYRDRLRKEVHRRGVEGVETPVFGKDGQIGSKLTYSDRMLELHIKRHDPAYRDKQTIDHNVKGGVLVVPGTAKDSKEWEQEE